MSETTADSALRVFLAERDVSCPHCGYNLRGLQSTVCPECRHALQLQLDGDFAARRYLWLVQALLLLLSVLGIAGFATSVWQIVTSYPLYAQGKLHMLPWIISLTSNVLAVVAYVYAWVRVRRAKRTGLHVIRAYVITIVVLFGATLLVFADWIFQWVAYWMGW
jgi:hypothetical protein